MTAPSCRDRRAQSGIDVVQLAIPSVVVGYCDGGCPRSDTLKAGWKAFDVDLEPVAGEVRGEQWIGVSNARGGFVARKHNVKRRQMQCYLNSWSRVGDTA